MPTRPNQLIIPPYMRQDGGWYILFRCGFHRSYHSREIHPEDVKKMVPDNYISVSEGSEVQNWKLAVLMGFGA